jgi:bifunctional non-homologous end joining protein LigD
MADARDLKRYVEQAGASPRAVRVDDVKLMLAETRDDPFTSDDWLFELKHDGFRLLAARHGDEVRLVYRRGNDATHVFPEIARALRELPFPDLVIDGEVVVLDASGRPSFQGMQKRVQLVRRIDLERAARERPATLFVFDLIGFEGLDLRRLPLLVRKEALSRLLPAEGPLRYADHVVAAGEALYEEVRKLGLEGIMAKRADSPYVGGRSPHWVKLRVDRAGDFVVVGFTRPQGVRTGFGALHLGSYQGERLVYVGRAGSGFGERQLQSVRRQLDAMVLPERACEGPWPIGRDHVWVRPELVCEVRYKEWTEEGLLRQPVFLRLRVDKAPGECRFEELLGGRPDLAKAATRLQERPDGDPRD